MRGMVITPAPRSEIDGPLATHGNWKGVFVHIKQI
jgi:hypothetical protein